MSKSRKRLRSGGQARESTIRLLARPRVEFDTDLAWRVLWTQPLAETRVAAALARAGLASYVPMRAIELIRRGRLEAITRPAIGRYVFVGIRDPGTDFARLRASLGQETPSTVEDVFSYVDWRTGEIVVVEVRQPEPPEPLARLLRVDDVPLRVPVDALQALEDGLSLHGQDEEARLAFLPGQAVTVRQGPWAGFIGEVERSDDERVRALFYVFGRQTPVEFLVDELEAAA